jgi:hypothetical protein
MKTNLKRIALLLLISISAVVSSAASGISKELPVSSFQKLSVSGNLHVVLTDGTHQMLRIEGSNKAVSSVVMSQRGSELHLSSTEWRKDDEPLAVYLHVTDLNMLIISGDATVECETIIHGSMLSLLHKGTGAVKLKSDADLIQTMTTRSGRIAVEGNYTNTVSRLDASNHMMVAYLK